MGCNNSIFVKSRSQIVSEIASSKIMQDLWNRYQRKYDYAEGITWNMLIGVNSLSQLMALRIISEIFASVASSNSVKNQDDPRS